MTELVDARVVAERFAVKPETVRTWTRQGRIPCIRPTRTTVRYDMADVEKALRRPRTRNCHA